ncbi:CRISPR-associated fruiting body developmental protein R [Myxococcus stipitatus DSM 14675]|uniref:CRISPR-associated fruiting body developmental protein R n=1 Tax=Myxococcus stipitatus (strain DSM 14675 / JCM 12634 / Mx s8) TaxID=1278073 RepID=L7URG0_MYXSD|nr:CRISPR-associated fruiting body developmental protein R [Myxococcus stipitatus]AGC49199.1 CRISPR-associated fruiting body developmental protein R [Myxococcus stipitatus DSM 14675]
MSHKNLFATVLTYAAPSSNYRGESEENRTVLQKISRAGGAEHTVISPESMRNALREILTKYGLPMNRRRLHDEDQLAVEYKDFPNAEKFADDFLFGFMVADPKTAKKHGNRPSKRDSVLRMNLAVALEAYRFDATFHQSPLNAGKSPWKNAPTSALLHREVTYTAYQYPFALAVADCLVVKQGKRWASALLKALGELSGVAGGHARSLFEMAPRSVVARLTPSLVSGYDSYGFDKEGAFPELARLTGARADLDAREFWLGGELVRRMKPEERAALESKGASLHDNAQGMLEQLATVAFAEA